MTTSLEALEVAGLGLENELTGAVTMLDEIGDQVRTDRESLARRLADVEIGQHVSFQFWLNDLTDAICFYKRIGEGVVLWRYVLDGMYPNEIEATISAVASQVGRLTPRTLAFAVDRRSLTIELDVDAMALERAGQYPDFPGDVFLTC